MMIIESLPFTFFEDGRNALGGGFMKVLEAQGKFWSTNDFDNSKDECKTSKHFLIVGEHNFGQTLERRLGKRSSNSFPTFIHVL